MLFGGKASENQRTRRRYLPRKPRAFSTFSMDEEDLYECIGFGRAESHTVDLPDALWALGGKCCKCPYCPFSTTRSGPLAQHVKTHTRGECMATEGRVGRAARSASHTRSRCWSGLQRKTMCTTHAFPCTDAGHDTSAVAACTGCRISIIPSLAELHFARCGSQSKLRYFAGGAGAGAAQPVLVPQSQSNPPEAAPPALRTVACEEVDCEGRTK